MRPIQSLICALLTSAVLNSAADQQVLFKSGDGRYHTYRIPALTKSTPGTLLAFVEGRESRKDHGNVDLLLRRSEDNGTTWGDMILVRDNGTRQAGNPCPLVDEETGNIILIFCESDVGEGQVLHGKGTREVMMIISKDDGKSWSEPRTISAMVKKDDWRWYAVGPCSGIQIKTGTFKGRLVIPANHSIHFSDGRKWEYRCHSIYSDDHGETWKIGSGSKAGASETQIAEVAPDLLIQDIRMQTHRKGVRAVRYSRDGSETWSSFEHDTDRPCPKCQGSIIGLPTIGTSTNRLISANPAGPGRTHMTVYSSDDGGKQWNKIAMLNEGCSAYSDLALTAGNQLASLYEAGENDPYETIVFRKIKPWSEIKNPHL